MSLAERFRDLSVKKRVVLAAVAAAVIAGLVMLIVILNNGYYAKTMRLLRIEGTVNIEDANGNARPVIDNIRFNSGEALSTGVDGLASVGLDDTKIVTLENNSRVEFTKSRNMLELNLTQGGLYFEVTEHLSADETFDIRTSTMTVGIRGTSGYVFYDDDGRESLIITDGRVHVVAKNPDTGEVRETYVEGGYSVKVYLYDETREEGSIEFFLDQLEEDEIPAFPLRMLSENPELLARVCEDTGWSADEILALADSLLNGDVITEETEQTEETSETEVTPTPVPDEDPEPSPSPSPTPSATPTPRPSVTPAPEDDADATPTPTPTGTPTPVPSATPSPEPEPTTAPTTAPTAAPTAAPTVTPEPTAEPTPDPTPEPTPDPEPEIPEGYEDYSPTVWGETYDGHDVYMIRGWNDDDSGWEYMAYVDDEWVNVDCVTGVNYGDGARNEYYISDTEGVYYASDYLAFPNQSASVVEDYWGITSFQGHSVYIVNIPGAETALGYVEGDGWVPVYEDERFYVHGDMYGIMYGYFLTTESDRESAYDDAYYIWALTS